MIKQEISTFLWVLGFIVLGIAMMLYFIGSKGWGVILSFLGLGLTIIVIALFVDYGKNAFKLGDNKSEEVEDVKNTKL